MLESGLRPSLIVLGLSSGEGIVDLEQGLSLPHGGSLVDQNTVKYAGDLRPDFDIDDSFDGDGIVLVGGLGAGLHGGYG